MNKHFEDTRYYLKRAGETAKRGVSEELESLRERVDVRTGKAEEPKPSRVAALRSDLASLQKRAAGEAKEAFRSARERLDRVS